MKEQSQQKPRLAVWSWYLRLLQHDLDQYILSHFFPLWLGDELRPGPMFRQLPVFSALHGRADSGFGERRGPTPAAPALLWSTVPAAVLLSRRAGPSGALWSQQHLRGGGRALHQSALGFTTRPARIPARRGRAQAVTDRRRLSGSLPPLISPDFLRRFVATLFGATLGALKRPRSARAWWVDPHPGEPNSNAPSSRRVIPPFFWGPIPPPLRPGQGQRAAAARLKTVKRKRREFGLSQSRYELLNT